MSPQVSPFRVPFSLLELKEDKSPEAVLKERLRHVPEQCGPQQLRRPWIFFKSWEAKQAKQERVAQPKQKSNGPSPWNIKLGG